MRVSMLLGCLLLGLPIWPGVALAATGPLPALINRAIAAHPSVKAQESLVAAGRSGVDSARWQYYPTPSISVQNASTSASDPSYQGDQRVTVMGLSQPIYTWGRLSASVAKAEVQAQIAVAQRDEAQNQLALRVVQSYGEWLNAHGKRLAYEDGVALHQRLERQVAHRVQEGQAAQSDLTLAQMRLAALQSDLAALRTQEQVGLSRLTLIVGQPLTPDDIKADLAQPVAVPQPLAALTEQAQSASPTVARFRLLAQAQLITADEIKASAMPEVSARLERQFGNASIANAPPTTRAFIGISSRFGAGLSSLSAVSEALARHTAALAEIESQQRSLSEQIMSDHALLVSSQARRQALQNSTELADQVLASWDRQYLSGRKNWQDLMNSAREQVQVKAQLIDLDGTQLVTSWRLAITTGQFVLPHASDGMATDLRAAPSPSP